MLMREQVLIGIADRGPCSVNALMEQFGLGRSAIHGHVKGLYAAGLVECERSPEEVQHRPAQLYAITPTGTQRIQEILAEHQAEATRLASLLAMHL